MGLCAQAAVAGAEPSTEGFLEGLIRAAAGGDEAALGSVYDATSHRVFGLALRILGDRASAEEAVMDVYSQVWQQAARFDRAKGNALAWLLTLTRSRAIDLLRSRSGRTIKEMDLEGVIPIPDTSPNPEESALVQQRATKVQRALEILTPAQREVIMAAFFEGLTHTEIAENLGTPLGTIKTRIRSGLLALREALAKDRVNLA